MYLCVSAPLPLRIWHLGQSNLPSFGFACSAPPTQTFIHDPKRNKSARWYHSNCRALSAAVARQRFQRFRSHSARALCMHTVPTVGVGARSEISVQARTSTRDAKLVRVKTLSWGGGQQNTSPVGGRAANLQAPAQGAASEGWRRCSTSCLPGAGSVQGDGATISTRWQLSKEAPSQDAACRAVRPTVLASQS